MKVCYVCFFLLTFLSEIKPCSAASLPSYQNKKYFTTTYIYVRTTTESIYRSCEKKERCSPEARAMQVDIYRLDFVFQMQFTKMLESTGMFFEIKSESV